jgi:vancomycin resistance protein VanJ
VKWIRRLFALLAVAYPLSLLVVTVTLRYVGERWWVSAVGLYLPRAGFALPLPFIAAALGVLRMRWFLGLQSVSALVIVFPLMGFVLPLHGLSRGDRATLRVLSFNVNSGRNGEQAVIDQVEHYSPDLVLFQEVGGGSRQIFEALLRARYPTVESSGQFVMATRYALSADGGPAVIKPSFQRYALDTPLGRTVVYNVHTNSPRGPLYEIRGRRGLPREILSGRVFRGAAAADVESNVVLRASEVQAFSDAAASETDPVLLAGDTNLPELSPLLHRYLSTYQDGFASAGWGFGYTFPADKWRPWMRIDRILVREPLRFVGFEIGQAHASDHFCVVGDLQRP